MLQAVSDLHGRKIHASDGEIGSVDQFFFDDQTWTIRYLVVDTGNWLPGRQALLSTIALGDTDLVADVLNVSLTKERITNSPDIDTDKPVSREHEAEHSDYYGYPHYWYGSGLGAGPYAGSLPGSMGYPDRVGVATGYAVTPALAQEGAPPEERGDPHLRSTKAVAGYYIEAKDGDIGHVQDFIIDDQTWEIRYLVVDTVNWWPGKKVVVAPQWIERVSWELSKVYVDLTRESIKQAPEYNLMSLINRDYEQRLYDHYGRSKYWA